ncbi:MAG: hypothetical protein HYZ54_07875 [Ignavibacteriae bacterium]|nr:hypothetical protein [Ignavibacteriota bacterium]
MKTFFRLGVIVCLVAGFTATDCQAKYRLTVENGGSHGYFYQLMRNCFGTLFSKKIDFECLRYTGKGRDTYIWGRTKDYNEFSESTLGDKAIMTNINPQDREAADYAIAQIRAGNYFGSKTMTSGKFVLWNRSQFEITVSVD